ncbi:MAG: glycerate-2-kinase family protein, partial [Desulfobulbaceae bacterium]|nr:glycerate-2-kinase family protein [Desulfobulbaceae bacterium]
MNIYERRKTARRIFESAVESVLPGRLITGSVVLQDNELHIHDAVHSLQPGRKVHVFGSGKASVGMARSLLRILKAQVAGGIIVTSQMTDDDLSPLLVVEGSHPVPDEKSVRGAELLIN